MAPLNQMETKHFDNGVTGKDSTYVLLDVSDRGIELPGDFDQAMYTTKQNLLIYAENITLTGDIQLPGKNIGLFCSSLSLANGKATVDVSGVPGVGVAAVPSGPGTPGERGQDAGSIWIYIQNSNLKVASGLRLLANGGDGGKGGDTSAVDVVAGNGGSGGNAGSIMWLWGSREGSALAQLSRVLPLGWVAALGQSAELATALDLLSPSSPLGDVLSRYSEYINAATACQSSLKLLLGKTAPSAPLRLAVDGFARGLSTLLSSQKGPDLRNDVLCRNTKAVTDAVKECLDNQSMGFIASDDEESLLLRLEDARTAWSGDDKSALRAAISEAAFAIQPLRQAIVTAVSGNCLVMPGTGGLGGVALGQGSNNGVRSPHGVNRDDSLACKELVFDGRSDDLDVPVAFAFPEQCQMLLNKANALFFQSTPESRQNALVLYQRLSRRLSFWRTIRETQRGSDTPPPVESNIEKSYNNLEYRLQVTISAYDQLEDVYSQAASFGKQILSGNDMFGHDPSWVPRLSAEYYKAEIDGFIDALASIEASYDQALEESAAKVDIAALKKAADSGFAQAQYRVKLLTGDNGPLLSSAYTISHYTPLLRTKIGKIQPLLEALQADIHAKLNIDPKAIISALSTIAMAPSKGLAVVEGAGLVFDALTTVKDNTGATVDKNYVISELKQAGSDLSQIAVSFSTRADQTIQADDPGGFKLLATADQIEDLYKKFQGSIDPIDGKDLIRGLKELRDVATTRNNAVISYNSAIELLQQALADVEHFEKKQKAYGDKAAKELNPHLPSITLWLRRTRDNFALETMRLMNFASRAIAYWGLSSPTEFSAPGPLKESQSLLLAKESLDMAAETAISNFAGSTPTHFPAPDIQGFMYQLDQDTVDTLKTQNKSAITHDTYYGVTVKLEPGAKDNNGGIALFAGCANVRLDRVRLWLLGASVKPKQSGRTPRRPIHVVITQLGSEVVESEDRKAFHFKHSPVTMPFTFESDGVTSIGDCRENKVTETLLLANYYVGQGKPSDANVIAAIGPWSTWVFEVRDSENDGLDMTGLTDAYIEFGGCYTTPRET
ncbi:hypothetical protein B0T14DRAFT_561490 [Immersiella caudata]|uniref:Uncharacterized protein n=1 Tax=Immersiella caudata TaxID=314043 RepID=A0AA40CE05_9PEZI|nr:hypothetical protein B0T14DRAFT_561490 [Immersiella caudata]